MLEGTETNPGEAGHVLLTGGINASLKFEVRMRR